MIYEAQSGHPGGSFSAADIVTALYYSEMRVDPKNPKDPDRDRFVLSKGHACPTLYAILADLGFFPKEDLADLRQINSHLQGHPDCTKTPGVDMNTGSLGQGASLAMGLALAAKHAKAEYKVYAVLGDGECQEGQVWEAAMFAAHQKLGRLVAIIDNNERNPLYGFAYSFSTGPKIDSLQVSGILLNARDLEPITGMLVGLHSDLEDSAFQKLPLERIASSDELGHFTIRNVTPGKYRLFALKDMNRDYRFDNPSEDIAFLDSIVIPSADVKLHVDTIWKDSVTIDTIIEYNHTHFYPNDILLTAFNEGFQSQYLDKSERKDRRKIDLYFKAPADSLPKLKPLNFEQEDWAILERSFHNDTLQYWIKDSLIYNMDTLLFTAEYFRTDTLRQLSLYNDTLKFIMKKVKAPKKKEKKKDKDNDSIEVPEIQFMQMNAKISSSLDVYKPLRFSFAEPFVVYFISTEYDGAEGGVKSGFICFGSSHFGFQLFAVRFHLLQSAQHFGTE